MKAYAVPRLPTAFPDRGARKKPRRHSIDHLTYIRLLPSVVSGKRGSIEAAHVRYTDQRYGKVNPGAAAKPDDMWALPLTAEEHRAQHTHGDEAGWWQAQGIDPLEICARLWIVSGDVEAGEQIIAQFREARAGAKVTR